MALYASYFVELIEVHSVPLKRRRYGMQVPQEEHVSLDWTSYEWCDTLSDRDNKFRCKGSL